MTYTHSQPQRRFIRFSLRGLLLLMLIISVALGWTIRLARQQSIAVAALEALGCKIEYVDYDSDDTPTFLERVRKLLGDDKWSNVVVVDGDDSQLNDKSMIHFQALPQVSDVRLNNTAVTDAGLAYLQTNNLRFLWLA